MYVFTVEGYEDCIVRSVVVQTELKTMTLILLLAIFFEILQDSDGI